MRRVVVVVAAVAGALFAQLVPVTAAPVSRVVTSAAATSGSPTGLIAYQRQTSAGYLDTTWTVDAATGATRRLARQMPEMFWSPDGRRLVGVVVRPKRQQGSGCDLCADLIVMAADGSHHHRVTTGHGTETQPVWSPDGTHIAYGHSVDGGKYTPANVYVTDVTGHHTRALTHFTTHGYADPLAWSPNSRRLLVDSNGLWVMNARTGHRHRLTPAPAEHHGHYVDDESATWSPTRNLVAFARYDSFNHDNDFTSTIYVISAAGTGRIRLSPRDVYAYDPEWSSDGKQVAFVGDPTADTGHGLCDHWRLYVANRDGSGLHRVTTVPHWIGEPSWSTNGEQIAFVGARADQPCSKDSNTADIYLVDARGSQPHRLTSHDRPDSLGDGPSWQPQGH